MTDALVGSFHDAQVREAAAARQASSPHHYARAAAAAQSVPPYAHTPVQSHQTLSSSNYSHNQSPLSSYTNLADRPGTPGRPLRNDQPNGQYNNKSTNLVRTTASAPSNSWNSLDMSGQGLLNLSPALFNFTFLEYLYLGHNNLRTLPAGIGKLKYLQVLDLTANFIETLPPQIGLLSNLKKLLLFDNNLQSLPSELGQLYHLELIGLEGNNALPEEIMKTLDESGTKALISSIRDSAPVSLPPAPREWIEPEMSSNSHRTPIDPNSQFAIMTYNILCDKYATAQLYGYTPSWALANKYRQDHIKQELLASDSDIICLQEIDVESHEDFFLPTLSSKGYATVFYNKTRPWTKTDSEKRNIDGCAIYFKESKFQLVDQQKLEFNQLALRRDDLKKTEDVYNRVMNKDNIATVALLLHKQTGSKLIVVSAHIHWDPAYKDVKLVQGALLLEELAQLEKKFYDMNLEPPEGLEGPMPRYASADKIPVVICGDFNSTPDSGVYELFSTGTVSANHSDLEDRVYGKFTQEGISHRLPLRSIYAGLNELPFTNYTPGFSGVIDYIWTSTASLSVDAVLGPVDSEYAKNVVGFPNPHFPSDHIPLSACLHFKSQKDSISHKSHAGDSAKK
ncbi:hypothetical protein CANCADRAFT_20833 [Tortispora caseinolytica NRRL Y-17796]|uniref:CCR4-Not complex 3'-5'-exoribonuclease subunit Ccr4 n=1 Tax=Tortispora caseinolytica NRRL Y-17796 TaxID=767744 RepID=A0A1E4TJP4_9ASCO|nr:hypothetical protein CANCADRAFT_20833 [Tortispora caseinolytica NRRL Y-17796]